ncbi:hypothetical protein ACSFBX_31680 [Variovorax sp. RB2P76]|uniref:hypothetical protein n=1 Tax=Variovorax sp. RB2P76 TaxID=3443736 RepID=UPI003F46366F
MSSSNLPEDKRLIELQRFELLASAVHDSATYMLDADGYLVSAAHPELDVSTYHLTVEIASTYESMCIFPPAEHLPCAQGDPPHLLQRPLSLAGQPQTTGHQ